MQRLEPARLDRSFVHPAGIQVGDLLLDAARRGLAGRKLIEDCVQIGLGLLEYDRAGAVAGAISRDLKAVEPFAVHVAKEVVAWLDARVHLSEIDTETADRQPSVAAAAPVGAGSLLHAASNAIAMSPANDAERMDASPCRSGFNPTSS